MGEFHYGDNLEVLRGRAIKDESVDLVYLDPPFNSQRTYNIIHREADGTASEAQRRAFEDNWTMDSKAQDALSFLLLPGKDRWKVPPQVSETFEMLQRILGSDSTMLAYLAMMGVRLVELRRVMKPTGSLFLHCDLTASHYLKIVLDSLFGTTSFRNEIIWQRTLSKGLSTKRLPNNHDVILRYSKGEEWTWNGEQGVVPYDPDDLDAKTSSKYCHRDPDGRIYRLSDLNNPNKDRPNLKYEFLGVTRVWRWTRERMQSAYEAGLVVQTKPGTVPQLKRYLDEQEGRPLGDVWTDSPPLNSQAKERLGYPTQKPMALLERIIRLASNEGDLVLDPFAGCGTTIEAAEHLGRRWVGIDVTHLAVSVLRRRMETKFPDLKLKLHGEPADAASARLLAKTNPHEFQAWIVDKVGGVPLEVSDDPKVAKKGGDRGIDGVLLFRDDPKAPRSQRMVISVKATTSVAPEMVRELRGTMVREKAALGALLLLTAPTDGMRKEAKADGQYRSENFKPVDKIQVLSVADLFAGKSLHVPGMITTHKSVPPAGAQGSSLELPFDKPIKPPVARAKRRPVPDEQVELPIAQRRQQRR